MARHFQHYFSLLDLAYCTWHRKEPLSKLRALLPQASHVLLLISDRAIESFIEAHLTDHPALRIHFSGSLVSNEAYGAHPLMSFSEKLYTLERYQMIPFVIDHPAPSFAHLLPGLPNPHWRLSLAFKAKYHALCVLSGNFTTLLWQKLFHDFENELQLPKESAHAYLQQCMQNLLDHPDQALTGPLVRQDTFTLENNLAALNNDPFQRIYRSFMTCYEEMISPHPNLPPQGEKEFTNL